MRIQGPPWIRIRSTELNEMHFAHRNFAFPLGHAFFVLKDNLNSTVGAGAGHHLYCPSHGYRRLVSRRHQPAHRSQSSPGCAAARVRPTNCSGIRLIIAFTSCCYGFRSRVLWSGTGELKSVVKVDLLKFCGEQKFFALFSLSRGHIFSCTVSKGTVQGDGSGRN